MRREDVSEKDAATLLGQTLGQCWEPSRSSPACRFIVSPVIEKVSGMLRPARGLVNQDTHVQVLMLVALPVTLRLKIREQGSPVPSDARSNSPMICRQQVLPPSTPLSRTPVYGHHNLLDGPQFPPPIWIWSRKNVDTCTNTECSKEEGQQHAERPRDASVFLSCIAHKAPREWQF